jgi:single-strand DNA-binding protein
LACSFDARLPSRHRWQKIERVANRFLKRFSGILRTVLGPGSGVPSQVMRTLLAEGPTNRSTELQMSFSINRVVLVGRLTKDAELRELRSGESVCVLRIACNSSQSDGEGGYLQQPNYFDVDVPGAYGEKVAQCIAKGSRVGIDGRLDWREWHNSFQEKREAVSIVADVVQFLDGAGGPRRMERQLQLVGAGGGDDEEDVLAF